MWKENCNETSYSNISITGKYMMIYSRKVDDKTAKYMAFSILFYIQTVIKSPLKITSINEGNMFHHLHFTLSSRFKRI